MVPNSSDACATVGSFVPSVGSSDTASEMIAESESCSEAISEKEKSSTSGEPESDIPEIDSSFCISDIVSDPGVSSSESTVSSIRSLLHTLQISSDPSAVSADPHFLLSLKQSGRSETGLDNYITSGTDTPSMVRQFAITCLAATTSAVLARVRASSPESFTRQTV